MWYITAVPWRAVTELMLQFQRTLPDVTKALKPKAIPFWKDKAKLLLDLALDVDEFVSRRLRSALQTSGTPDGSERGRTGSGGGAARLKRARAAGDSRLLELEPVRGWIAEAIAEVCPDGPDKKLMGKVMGALMKAHKGEFDGKEANKWVGEMLTPS